MLPRACPGPCPPGSRGLAVTPASLAYVDKDLWLQSRLLGPPGSNEGHSAFPVAFQCLMVISGPMCHLCWEELGLVGWVSLCRAGGTLPSSGGPLRPDPGTKQVCLFSCVLAVPPCPCPGECAQLASPGTRLSCSSLIYYKGDGDNSHVSLRGFSIPADPASLDLSVAMSQEAGDGISAGSASFV